MTERERQRYNEEFKPAYVKFMELYPFTSDDLPGEVWRELAPKYHLSTYGRCKSFWGKEPRIMKPALTQTGYLQFTFSVDGKKVHRKVHVLVATLFIPNPEGKPEVNHLCGRFNNCVECLEWTTRLENERHAVLTGLHPQGEDFPTAKITNELATWCRSVYKPRDKKYGAKALSRLLNVNEVTIREIVHGKTYKSADGTIHAPEERLTPAQRAEIRRVYIKGDKEFGAKPLARKYGVDSHTIRYIVQE